MFASLKFANTNIRFLRRFDFKVQLGPHAVKAWGSSSFFICPLPSLFLITPPLPPLNTPPRHCCHPHYTGSPTPTFPHLALFSFHTPSSCIPFFLPSSSCSFFALPFLLSRVKDWSPYLSRAVQRQGLINAPPTISQTQFSTSSILLLTHGSRLSALGSRLSALGSRDRLLALGSRLSALGFWLSTLGSRLSAFTYVF